MTELVPGANAPLPGGPVQVRLAGPFDLCALIVSAHGKVDGDDDFVFFNQPRTSGVTLGGREVTIIPTALRHGAERVVIAASPEDGTTPFGQLPPPVVTLHNERGNVLAHFAPPPLTSETVLTLVEIYRRGPGWKVRAVGQGYADPPPAPAAPPAGSSPSAAPDQPPAALPAPRPAPPARTPSAPVVGAMRAAAPAPAGPLDDGTGSTPMLAQVVALTNAERERVGLHPLSVDPTLAAAADAHSRDMAARGFFAHTSPDGRSVSDRVVALGYRYSRVAENIAAGQTSAEEVVTGWMNSPGHRANILIPQLRQIGVGYATGGEFGTYWTQVFGTLL
ncbi:CAP domain-containing protein [Frankia sp. AgB32]|uniref:CAP domain-containing protein n=1 Tax=Frankia sp. AgB32 TaxID=631119 RepID=UPI00200EB180|nr:CAP domain-containing protein [Frankia sp. AgB32]MCK9895536.1 CAP domain-containing protein [Frankia sp. AgB32]